MIINMTGGGGGAPLNFEVVGNPQPDNPKENTIWINTDVKITSRVFSATAPEKTTEGMVWIFTGAYSDVEFNALKKDVIQVYPLSAKQYVGGAWVNVTAMSYQGGEWKTWILRLFDYGKQPYKWQARSWSMVKDVTAITPSVTKNTDGSVKISVTVNSAVGSGAYELVEDFDITNVKTLTADIDGGFLCVVQRNAQYFRENAVAWTAVSGGKAALDVSGIEGKHDIVIGINRNVYNSGAGTTTVTFKSLTAQ